MNLKWIFSFAKQLAKNNFLVFYLERKIVGPVHVIRDQDEMIVDIIRLCKWTTYLKTMYCLKLEFNLQIKVGSKASIFTIYSVMQMARIKSIAESDCQLTS